MSEQLQMEHHDMLPITRKRGGGREGEGEREGERGRRGREKGGGEIHNYKNVDYTCKRSFTLW